MAKVGSIPASHSCVIYNLYTPVIIRGGSENLDNRHEIIEQQARDFVSQLIMCI